MDETLHALMLADTALAALVGPNVYWGLAPQGVAAPYITMHQISARDHRHMQGAGGLLTYRVQIDSYGADRPQAVAVARAVRAAINGTQAGALRLVLLDTKREGFSDTAAEGLSVIMQDYIVTWRPDHG